MLATDVLAELEERWNDRKAKPLSQREREKLIALSEAIAL